MNMTIFPSFIVKIYLTISVLLFVFFSLNFLWSRFKMKHRGASFMSTEDKLELIENKYIKKILKFLLKAFKILFMEGHYRVLLVTKTPLGNLCITYDNVEDARSIINQYSSENANSDFTFQPIQNERHQEVIHLKKGDIVQASYKFVSNFNSEFLEVIKTFMFKRQIAYIRLRDIFSLYLLIMILIAGFQLFITGARFDSDFVRIMGNASFDIGIIFLGGLCLHIAINLLNLKKEIINFRTKSLTKGHTVLEQIVISIMGVWIVAICMPELFFVLFEAVLN